jgi:hypothetical protein
MKPEASLSCSQEPANGKETAESHLQALLEHPFYMILLSTCMSSKQYHPSALPTKKYIHFSSSVCVLHVPTILLLDFISIIFGEEYYYAVNHYITFSIPPFLFPIYKLI